MDYLGRSDHSRCQTPNYILMISTRLFIGIDVISFKRIINGYVGQKGSTVELQWLECLWDQAN